MKLSPNNYEQMKEICDSLSKIVSISSNQTMNFINYLVYAIIHELAMESADNTNGKITETEIEIPAIGCISIKLGSDGSVIESNIKLEECFKEYIKSAVTDFKSPLIEKAADTVIDKIKKQYKALI